MPAEASPGEWEHLLDNDILLKVLVAGDEAGPDLKDTVICSYVGRLRDTREPFIRENAARFTIGEGETTMGLELALRHMHFGETALVVVAPKYAYGPFGRRSLTAEEAAVPPEAWLEYEVQLQSSVFIAEAPLEEKVIHGQYQKTKGNDHFRRQELREAMKMYSSVIKLLGALDDSPEATALVVDCHNNSAAVLAKQEQWNKAKEACVAALSLDPDNLRALERAADVAMSLADWEEAEMAWQRALEVDPDCKFAQQGLARLAKKRSDFKKKEREMFGGKLAKRAAAAAAAAAPASKAEPPAVKAPPPAPAGDPDAAATAGTGASAPAPAEESGLADSPTEGPSPGNETPAAAQSDTAVPDALGADGAAGESTAPPAKEVEYPNGGRIGGRNFLQLLLGVVLALGLAAWDPTGGASGPPGSAPPAPPPRPPPVAVPEEAVEWDDDL